MPHTPGPWEAVNNIGAGWSVRKRDERPGYTGRAPICSMAWFQFDIPGIIDDEISGANAMLIAAAPALLTALKTVRAWCQLNKREGSVIYKPVCAAIALAEPE